MQHRLTHCPICGVRVYATHDCTKARPVTPKPSDFWDQVEAAKAAHQRQKEQERVEPLELPILRVVR